VYYKRYRPEVKTLPDSFDELNSERVELLKTVMRSKNKIVIVRFLRQAQDQRLVEN